MHLELEPATGRALRLLVVFVFLGGATLNLLVREAHAGSPSLDYNRDIRPILSENCFFCHGQDPNKRQAGLRLDVRDAAIEAGAIVPDNPRESELVLRVNSTNP